MIALIFALLQFAMISFAIYGLQKNGYWNWAKFFLTIVFTVFEGFLISAPLILLNQQSRWFWPACAFTWLTVAVFGFFFFRAARHWTVAPSS